MMMEWYDQIQRDVRLAGRRAINQGTFTVVVIVCVALGVGSMTAALSVLHPVLLSALPYEAPEELVQIAAFNVNRTNEDERYFVSWFPIDALNREREVLEGVAAFYQRDFDVLDGTEPERIPGAETLPGSFGVLGVQPVIGRTLHPDDVRLGNRVALISESLWARRYGRDAEVLGRTVLLGDQAHVIVGVMPGSIRFTARAEVFPVHHPDDYSRTEQLGMGAFLTIARLPEGAGLDAGQQDLDAMLRSILDAEPIFYRDFGFDMMGLQEFLVGDFERPLWAFLAAAVLVLLLAAANVANLLIARAQGDQWEQGLRTALGAQCRRLAQQGLVENLALAGIGGAGGVALAALGVRALLASSTINSPALDGAGLSVPVVVFALGVASALAALMSFLSAARCYSSISLLRGSREGQRGRGERRAQTGFVVAQVALSFILLVGAGLTLRSVSKLSALDLGFETESLILARVSAPASLAGTVEGRAGFTREVLARVQALSGVDAAGATSWVPFSDGDVAFNYSVEDYPPEVAGERALAPGRIVSPGYFASMGVPLLSGRSFTDADRMDTPLVAIVSREFQRRYWPDGSALGKRIKRGAYSLERPWIEIVGVVGDIRSGSLSDSIRPAMFYPQSQTNGAFLSQMAYTVRSSGDPSTVVSGIRAAVRDLSGAATVYGVSTGVEVRSIALGRGRFISLVIGLFAAIGLILATAGAFGVTAYGVGRRTREFGVRVALGAQPAQVRGLVLKNALGVAALGIGLGGLGAVALTTGLSEILFEVDTSDGLTYVGVAGVLAASVLLASYIPARRATHIDPTVALKSE